MANPPDLQYCKVYGNFKAFVADAADTDDLPDFVPMTGYGEIYPNVEIARNTSLGFKSTYFNSPISLTVDANGDLSQGGRKYVMVLASSSNINPVGFNYTIHLTLTAQGESKPRTYGPFAFDVVPGGEVDLTDVFPIAASAGSTIIQGPRGEVGPAGPVGPIGLGVPAGGSALQLVRKTASNTDTEWVTPDKALIGLGNVDNTSDANKPISTATQTALNLKAPLASPTFTGTVAGVSKTMVGLGNVDNTSDANKPISTAQQTELTKLPKGLVTITELTAISGTSTGLIVILNIPSFTFLANRWYEIEWTAGVVNTTGASTAPVVQLMTTPTTETAASTANLTEIMNGNVSHTVANQTVRVNPRRKIKFATDTTLQIKATLNGNGQSCYVGAGATWPSQLSIFDLGTVGVKI